MTGRLSNLRGEPRRVPCPWWGSGAVRLVAAFVLCFPIAGLVPHVRADEDSPIVYEMVGPLRHSNLGRRVVALGDIDGDAAADFAVGVPGDSRRGQLNPLLRGYVLVISGATGEALRAFAGTDEIGPHGRSMTALPDLDGDGASELGIFANLDLRVYDPLTGELIYTIRLHEPGGYESRWDNTTTLDDVDGDGVLDFAIGLPQFARVGAYSGKSGERLWEIQSGGRFESRFGLDSALIGDVTGDGLRDLVVTRPHLGDSKVPGFEFVPSQLWLVDSRTGETIEVYEAPRWMDRLGGFEIASLGDRDRDGKYEIAVGAPNTDNGPRRDVGWFGVFEVPGFEIEYERTGESDHQVSWWSDNLGGDCVAVGDVDGDTITDYVVTTNRSPAVAPRAYRRFYLRSGRDDRLLTAYDVELDDGSSEWYGASKLGDIDGDGRAEFILVNAGPVQWADYSGHLLVVRHDDSVAPFMRGDANQDGQLSLEDVVAIAKAVRERSDPSGCLAALDVNNTDVVTFDDALRLAYHLFSMTPPWPESPYRECGRYVRLVGREPLGCEGHAVCR